jgi:hypothetical protein
MLDAAQVGAIGTVVATVTEERLATALGSDSMAVEFNYSNWAIMTDVGPDVTVWMRGDVQYRVDAVAEPETLTDVPLLVSFEPNGPERGLIVYSAFHIDVQTGYAMDEILRTVVGDFEENNLDSLYIEE